MVLKENSLLKKIMCKIKKDPQEVLLRASVPGGAILGAIYMVATTTAPPVIAGAIGVAVGAVGLPVAIMTSIVFYVAVKTAAVSATKKPLATALGQKIGNGFSGIRRQPSVTPPAVQAGFNAEALPVKKNTAPPAIGDAPAHRQ